MVQYTVKRGWNPNKRQETKMWEIRETWSNKLVHKARTFNNANNWLKKNARK